MALPHNKVLKNYLKQTFIETGTESGDGIIQVLMFDFVEKIHSIELNRHFFAEMSKKFSTEVKVQIHYGDSRNVLPTLLEELGENQATIWLDAHDNNHIQCSPLMDELHIIHQYSHSQNVILIDDIPQIGKPNTWGRNLSLYDIKKKLLSINADYEIRPLSGPYELSSHKTYNVLAVKPYATSK
jgi:hypothetical protein